METLHDVLYPDEPREPATCAYVAKSGKTCSTIPSEGEIYCVIHGADIARAQDRMQRRLLSLQEKAIKALETLFDFCADDRVTLEAAKAVLDRTGLGPRSTLQVDQRQEDLSNLSELELAERAEKASKRLRELHMLRMSDDVAKRDVTH